MDLVQPRQLLATASVVGLALILVAARQDYNVYLSYGPGGLPYNIQGWLISNMMRLYSKDPFSTSQPLWPAQKDETLSFLSQPFPKRSGGRPKVGPHPIPQRQLEQLGPPNMKQKMEAEFEALALRARDQGLVEVKKSGYERHFDAMFVATGRERNDTAKQTNGEITHIHRGIDGSVHVVLAAADSKSQSRSISCQEKKTLMRFSRQNGHREWLGPASRTERSAQKRTTTWPASDTLDLYFFVLSSQ